MPEARSQAAAATFRSMSMRRSGRAARAGAALVAAGLLLAPGALAARAAAPAPSAAAAHAAPPAAASTSPRRIAETDLFHFVWVADPQLSPDGSRIAFVRVTVNARRDGYETALWIAAANPGATGAAGTTLGDPAPRPLTSGLHDSSPRWSPDGRRLAFVRQEGKVPQLFVLPLDGGEARQLTDLPRGATDPSWSPDGRRLAFLSSSVAADGAKREKGEKRDADGLAGHDSDVRVITRAIYRFNGAGYGDPSHPDHVWTVDVAAAGDEMPHARPLTRGEFSEGDLVWAPDGSRLYLVSERDKEPYYQASNEAIYSVAATPAALENGAELVKVAAFDGSIRSELAVSPDGRQIAFLGSARANPTRSFDKSDLWVVAAGPAAHPATAPATPAGPRNLTAALDGDLGGGLVGDQHAPRGGGRQAPMWSADGRSLIAPVAERGRLDLRRFDLAGGPPIAVTKGDHEVVGYDMTPDGAHLALILSTPTAIGDLYALDLSASAPSASSSGATGAAGALRKLTGFNEALFSHLDLTLPERITYRSFDGREIEAWVQKPPDFVAGRKYPMILNIHGGPHAAYGWTFFHEAQWMAAKGYVVLCPNPRGSSSYGEEFGNVIQYHFPGDDYRDLMAGVDDLLRRGEVDPQRLGVTGGSGGGLLTNWTVTQTDRFAAAVSQRSIADWSGFWYTADFTLFTPTWFHGAPWQDPQDFAARSPITYIEKVKTPLMLIEGEADLRTPPTSGGEQMFRALKYLHRPVVMVRFPGESHELSRSGQPWHRVERLQHIVRWFDKYLQGEKTDLYDVP
jgi:dipeptidyl aminopeptidase/acylaminoacyl peptidase